MQRKSSFGKRPKPPLHQIGKAGKGGDGSSPCPRVDSRQDLLTSPARAAESRVPSLDGVLSVEIRDSSPAPAANSPPSPAGAATAPLPNSVSSASGSYTSPRSSAAAIDSALEVYVMHLGGLADLTTPANSPLQHAICRPNRGETPDPTPFDTMPGRRLPESATHALPPLSDVRASASAPGHATPGQGNLSPLSMPSHAEFPRGGRPRAMSLKNSTVAMPTALGVAGGETRPPTALMRRRSVHSQQSHVTMTTDYTQCAGRPLAGDSATDLTSEVEEHILFQAPGLTVREDQHDTFTRMNELIVLSEIASGATANVYQVCDETETMFAMKCVSRKQLRHVEREVECLRQLSHRGVPHLHQMVDCPEYPEVFLVMEFIDGAPICKMGSDGLLNGEPWKEEDAQPVFITTLEVVEYLHNNGVMHRDIKPDNILYERHTGRVVLVDFGVSLKTNRDDDSFERTVGTPFFLPPEASAEGFVVAKMFDLWGLAVVFYLLLVGRVPYGAGCRGGPLLLADRVKEDKLRFDCPYPISQEAQSLLAQMLDKDLACRPSICAIKDSPWVTGSLLPVPLTRMPTSRSLRGGGPQRPAEAAGEESAPQSLSNTPAMRTLDAMNIAQSVGTSSLEDSFFGASECTGWMLEGDATNASFREPRRLRKVLIADACFHSRRIAKALLKELVVHDFEVEFCSDGEAALQASDAERPDLALVDLHIPRLSGLETALRLRQKETGPGRSVIIALAMDLQAVADLSPVFCEAGLDGALRKPLNWKALHTALRQTGFQVKKEEDIDPDRAFNAGHQFDISYRRRSSSQGSGSSVGQRDWLSPQAFASHCLLKDRSFPRKRFSFSLPGIPTQPDVPEQAGDACV
eukprot:Hpha_TRINITY_DN16226_c2_g3::TRINITY_DN16226_c2_g3_i1::g.15101::m.15101/K07359/CAMKK2; calcium/calmodulin-dependent protein kinase kinase 2